MAGPLESLEMVPPWAMTASACARNRTTIRLYARVAKDIALACSVCLIFSSFGVVEARACR